MFGDLGGIALPVVLSLIVLEIWLIVHVERKPKPRQTTTKPATKPATTLDSTHGGPSANGTPLKRPPNQPDAILVLDFEATCISGTGFDWPNEIIEWPVVLLKWKKFITETGMEKRLVVEDEFRSFVKPTWKPVLDAFCTSLTGVTQSDVDDAPLFGGVVNQFTAWLHKHKLVDEQGKPISHFVFATDGPWDLRDFFQKSIYLSQTRNPPWFPKKFLDVREATGVWYKNDFLTQYNTKPGKSHGYFSMRVSFKLVKQLKVLGLGEFEGREHCGIDDTRNIARIVIELARRNQDLRPNAELTKTRWAWMGDNGSVVGYT